MAPAQASFQNKENLPSFAEARSIVESHAARLLAAKPLADPPALERVPLLESLGRVLAEPVMADRDFPPFPRATRDGFAVRSDELRSLPAHLRVVGQLRAGGQLPAGFTELHPGEALEIMTGAAAPAGADAVVMVEFTRRPSITEVVIERSAVGGENIVPRASEARAGERLLEPGRRISTAEIAMAAAVGFYELAVYRRPRVAILSTGDEIVPIQEAPAPDQIRNSNSYSLAAQVKLAGGEPVMLPIAPDEPQRLAELLAQGLEADLLLITGGVSAGEYDLVEPVLGRFQAEFHFTGARIQPGKPVVFGTARSRSGKTTPFLGLPGNPISTITCFDLFARTLLDALGGAAPAALRFFPANLASPYKTKPGLTRFLPARCTGEPGKTEVEIVPWQGSGDLVAFARANCYVVLPPEKEEYAAGDLVTVLPRL